MSRGTNKGIQTTKDPGMRLIHEALSKAALFDLAVDLVRRVNGDEHLDGEGLVEAFRDAHEPVRHLRRDLPIRVKSRDRSTDADRLAILDAVEIRTGGSTHGRMLHSESLFETMRMMRITRDQGANDLTQLIAQGRLERVIEDRDVWYRLTAEEWRRRQLARARASSSGP